ncbi:MAG: hypothetical protein ACSNEK_01435 [Parachlamydiaceae bacterium]
MKKVVSIDHNQPMVEDPTVRGLAPIVCYEPWFPRCLEAIRQCLNDGHPVLVRLHSAANYPNTVGDCYQLDLESQAVLIVGYDDEKQAVAIIDPWNNNWGGEIGGRRWITYLDLSRQVVNTSLGMGMCLTPPQVNLTPKVDIHHNLSIDANIGFYSPRGVVMDRESWAIKKVLVECKIPKHLGETVYYEVEGHWIVGDLISLSMPITNNLTSDVEIEVLIRVVIQGERPYKFHDHIEITKKVLVNTIASKSKDYNSFVI